MKKRAVTLLLCLVLVVLSLLRGFAASAAGIIPATNADFDVPCAAAILIDEDSGTVLYEKNADARRPIASITKVMTLLLAFEALEAGKIHLDDFVPVSEHAYHMGGSQIWLEPGEQMTLDDMLKAICISSANDAAVAVAEYVGGSETAFAEMMNVRAYELGMTNTVFKNTNGLDDTVEGHVTTARDIAVMSRELITKHPKILEYSSIWMDTIRNGAFGLTNTNRLVRFYRGANGLKTGSTSKAKFCISATALRDGMQLIAVVMASPTRDARNESAKKLLDYGFANFEVARLTPGELPPLRVVGGVASAVPVTSDVTPLVVKKGEAGKISCELSLPEDIAAPVSGGDEVGRAVYYLNGEEIASAPVRAAESVGKIGFTGLFCEFFTRMLLCRA